MFTGEIAWTAHDTSLIGGRQTVVYPSEGINVQRRRSLRRRRAKIQGKFGVAVRFASSGITVLSSGKTPIRVLELWTKMDSAYKMARDRRRRQAGPPDVIPEALLSTGQIAQWLGISARTVSYWAAAGVIPAIKVGRHWRFEHAAVQKWIDSRQRRTRE